jgi:hypothetical protein
VGKSNERTNKRKNERTKERTKGAKELWRWTARQDSEGVGGREGLGLRTISDIPGDKLDVDIDVINEAKRAAQNSDTDLICTFLVKKLLINYLIF